ncbi:MAG: hypothetical protein GX257_06305 [Clostridiales bacterium]|nr:hypothetical protein [Clostridiales bacterium]
MIRYSKYSTKSEPLRMEHNRIRKSYRKNQFAVKSALPVLLLLVLLVSFCSCSSKVDNDNVEIAKDQVIYHNGVYGISLTVPEDWLVAAINKTNMTASPQESSEYNLLEVTPYEDSGSVIQFVELWNRPDSADKEHASLMVYIEIFDYESEDTYLSAFEEAYSGDFNGYISSLKAKEEVVLGGKEYTLLQFLTQLPNGEDEYFEEYYISQIEADKYLVLCTTYWADNEASKDSADAALRLVAIE